MALPELSSLILAATYPVTRHAKGGGLRMKLQGLE